MVVGGEVLYQPFQSRLAYGLSANCGAASEIMIKSFKHLDYQTTTAFASVYWASPVLVTSMLRSMPVRYLAKDVGATSRRSADPLANGWMVGLWATITRLCHLMILGKAVLTRVCSSKYRLRQTIW